jgi:DNA polymerase V
MLTLISDKAKSQETLFDDSLQRVQSAKLMAAIDAINAEFGRDTVSTGASGTDKRRAMRSENRSPRFTTRWDELPVAQ